MTNKHTPGKWLDCGMRKLATPDGHNIDTRCVEAEGWGRIFEVYDYSNEPDENFDRILECVNSLSGIDKPAEFMRILRHSLDYIASLEKHAEESVGMVDDPHMKALRKASAEARSLLSALSPKK